MAPNRKPSRPAGPPGGSTTITEIARRYAACGQALARVFGLPFTEAFVKDFHEAIACVFIEAGRCDLRLPARVTLPPLVQEPEASNRAIAEAIGVAPATIDRDVHAASDEAELDAEAQETLDRHKPSASDEAPESPAELEDEEDAWEEMDDAKAASVADHGDAALPTTIPDDGNLPCGGQGIERLKPAQLAMLLGKVARLAEAKGGQWDTLRQALQAERARRVAQGQRRARPEEGRGDNPD